MSNEIYVTTTDRERIRKRLEKMYEDHQTLDKSVRKLDYELNRARVVDRDRIPPDVITMRSRVLLHMEGEDTEVSLVYPEEADLGSMKLSVFSPIGTAILGYREGDAIEWEVPSGTSTIHIKKLLYQPESAGDPEL